MNFSAPKPDKKEQPFSNEKFDNSFLQKTSASLLMFFSLLTMGCNTATIKNINYKNDPLINKKLIPEIKKFEIYDATEKLDKKNLDALSKYFIRATSIINIEDSKFKIIVVDKIDQNLASKHRFLSNLSDAVIRHIRELNKSQRVTNYTIRNPSSDPYRYTTIVDMSYFQLSPKEQQDKAEHEVIHFYVNKECHNRSSDKSCTLEGQEKAVEDYQWKINNH